MSTISKSITKQEIVQMHLERELGRDWDGTLATMIDDDPSYELYPFGIRVRGRAAIKEYWRRLFDVAEFIPTVSEANQVAWYTDDTAVLLLEWEVKQADGSTVMSRAWSLFHFRDGLIESERIYGDEISDRLLTPVLSEEFLNYPGVERITRSSG